MPKLGPLQKNRQTGLRICFKKQLPLAPKVFGICFFKQAEHDKAGQKQPFDSPVKAFDHGC